MKSFVDCNHPYSSILRNPVRQFYNAPLVTLCVVQFQTLTVVSPSKQWYSITEEHWKLCQLERIDLVFAEKRLCEGCAANESDVIKLLFQCSRFLGDGIVYERYSVCCG